MVVDYKSANGRFKIPDQINNYVFWNDIFNTPDKTLEDPLAGIWFRIERGPPVGPGVHGYDEAGVVWEGTVTLSDESGRKRTLGPGDSFFIHRGSTVKFSSENYGVCFKCAARPRGKLDMSLSPMLTYDAIKDTLRIGIVDMVVIAENDSLIKGGLERKTRR